MAGDGVRPRSEISLGMMFPRMMSSERMLMMQEIAIAFCKALEEQMTEKINAKTEEVIRSMRRNEWNNTKLEKRMNILEKQLWKEIRKNNDLAVKKKRLRISDEDIARIRRNLNLTQAVFAQLLGVDRSCVNRWERGRVRPSQRTMYKIVPFRDMSQSELAKRRQKLEAEVWK